jgi:hypothetical protein
MVNSYTKLYEDYLKYKQLFKLEKDNSGIFRSFYLSSLRELLFISERNIGKLGLSRKSLELEHTLECLR